MVTTAARLKWEVLESELEALLVEAELIRIHQPPTNILLKDDKTPLYVHITSEEFPKVLTIRKHDVDRQNIKGTILGPFPSGYKVKEVLDIARRIFPWCNHHRTSPPSHKACFYYHLELCPGVCLGKISPGEYQQNIKNLILFLKGEKKSVIRDMTNEMNSYAHQEEFEKAAQLRDKIQRVVMVTSKQYRLKPDVVLPQLRDSQAAEGLIHLRKIVRDHFALPRTYTLSRIEGYDVSNTQGTLASVAMVTFVDGQPAPEEYRLFNIKTLNTPNDYHMMKEALTRRQNNFEWGIPDLLVIDGGKGQLRSALRVWNRPTPIISIVKRPDRIIVPLQNPAGKTEYKIIKLPENHPTLQLIQHIRDEAHRFSKKQHSGRRLKSMFK